MSSSDTFVIEGLRGEKKLSGVIPVRGAKNAVLKSMAASLLFKDELHILNVPNIEDVSRMAELLIDLGATVLKKGERVYVIETSAVKKTDLDDSVARRLRASIVLAGPLLGRFGNVSFPHPGGDVIGPRPINLFLDGFKQMGCEVLVYGDRYTVIAPPGGLRGADFFFLFVSVTGTETLMMAAVLAKGKTVLRNAAMEPEIVALADFLNSCGARIRGAGTPTIEIEGGGLLSASENVFETIPDRIEAGSLLILGALAGEKLTITDCLPEHIGILIHLLKESGVSIDVSSKEITVSGGERYLPLHVRTHEYPGFATDLQPGMTVYLTQAEGESTVFETIWGGRLQYTDELVRMGADIALWNPQQITVKGRTPFVGRELESPDIRAGLAFILAAIIANGKSVIHNVYNIDRGYEKIEERLQNVGVDIKRIG